MSTADTPDRPGSITLPLGGVFFVLALVLALTSLNLHRGRTLDEPLPLPGQSQVLEPFQTHVDGDHWISLSGENLDGDQLECFHGRRLAGRRDCLGVPAIASVRWKVEADGREVTSGRSEDLWPVSFGDSRRIGRFDAEAGVTYVLTVTHETAAAARPVVGSDRPSTPVAQTAPRVQVHESLDLVLGQMIVRTFQRVGAGVIALIGVILVAVGLYRRYRARRRAVGVP